MGSSHGGTLPRAGRSNPYEEAHRRVSARRSHGPGKLLAADVLELKDGSKIKTVEGSPFTLANQRGKVMVGDAKVLTTDILCTNGVIHAIDTVMMPPAETPTPVD
jgi:hypothetical protein